MPPKELPTTVDISELVQDADDSSLKIFSMYLRKNYLPHNERVSNIAWRIQNRKTVRQSSGRVGGRVLKQGKESMAMGPGAPETNVKHSRNMDAATNINTNTNTNVDEFDYVAHIRRISQAEYDGNPRLVTLLASARAYPMSQTASAPPNNTLPPLAPLAPLAGISRSASKRRAPQARYAGHSSSFSQSQDMDPQGSLVSSYIHSLEASYQTDRNQNNPGVHRNRANSSTAAMASHYISDKLAQASSLNKAMECSNCHTKTTPLWRKTPAGDTLCNACGLFHKLHGTLRPANQNFSPRPQISAQGSSQYTQTSAIPPALKATGSVNNPGFKWPADGAISSQNTGLFSQMGDFMGANSSDSVNDHSLMFHNPSHIVSTGTTMPAAHNQKPHDAFFGYDFLSLQTGTLDPPLGKENPNSASHSTDEIDKLLNMNLFQLDLFIIGADKNPSSEVATHNYDIRGMEAADEILIDEPTTGANNWNWLDFNQ